MVGADGPSAGKTPSRSAAATSRPGASAQPSDLLAALAVVRVAAKQVGGLAEAGRCDG